MTRPIELAKVPLDRKALILRHDLFGEPSPPSWSTQVLMRAGRDQMAVQDRLYDVLEPGALPHDLVATGEGPPQHLRGRSRHGPRHRQDRCVSHLTAAAEEGRDAVRASQAHPPPRPPPPARTMRRSRRVPPRCHRPEPPESGEAHSRNGSPGHLSGTDEPPPCT